MRSSPNADPFLRCAAMETMSAHDGPQSMVRTKAPNCVMACFLAFSTKHVSVVGTAAKVALKCCIHRSAASDLSATGVPSERSSNGNDRGFCFCNLLVCRKTCLVLLFSAWTAMESATPRMCRNHSFWSCLRNGFLEALSCSRCLGEIEFA